MQSWAQGPSHPTPLHPVQVGTCQRRVYPLNGATGLGRKRRVQRSEKYGLKMEKKLLPGSTCPNQTHKARLFRSGAVLLPYLTPEDSAELITSPGGGRAQGRAQRLAVPCGLWLWAPEDCPLCLGPCPTAPALTAVWQVPGGTY